MLLEFGNVQVGGEKKEGGRRGRGREEIDCSGAKPH
jgi:hypothetical protein